MNTDIDGSDPLPVVGCSLDEGGLRDQRQRYRQLSGSVTRVERRVGQLLVQFAHDVDRGLLEQTLAVEQRCCAFFRVEYAPGQRYLAVGVKDPDQEAALDALRAVIDPVVVSA